MTTTGGTAEQAAEAPQAGRIAAVAIDIGPPTRCHSPAAVAVHEGDVCIVDVEGVLECGPIVSLADAPAGEDVRKLPQLVRRSTLQDQTRSKETELLGKIAVEKCTAAVSRYSLPMRLVRVRYSFDRQVLSVLFCSEERVDFREMIKDLSSQLHVRVRMKQIGVRDEAAIIGGLGPCGRSLCCCSWLRRFDSVNVRMAKTQRISMNPNAISGMCGRLKCCLRYENDVYRDMDHALPRDGDTVTCPEGRGVVVDKNIMGQTVRIRLEDQRVVECAAVDVREAAEQRE